MGGYGKEERPDGTTALKQALRNKTPGNFYIFFGEEAYLKAYYLDQLRRLLTEGPTEEFNFRSFDAETMQVEAFRDAVEALPMMAERTMVFVDDIDLFKMNDSDRTRMAEILSDLPDYCCVVLYYETVPFKPDRRQKKLCQALDRAEQVEFRKQSGRELTGWIRRHFRGRQKEIDENLCQYLIFITGGGMTALAAEIEKIASYAEETRITKEDIDAVVEPVLDAAVFDITDAFAAGDFSRALEKLRTVLRMQQEPIPVLGAIGAQMRRMRAAKLLAANGKGGDTLATLCGISSYPAQKTMQAAAHFSTEFCDKAVLLCTETDYQMKTSFDDPERLLELLILKLAAEAEHG